MQRIATQQGYLNFYFNLLYTADGVRYHVSVIGKDRKSIMFQMEEANGRWYIVNPANCPEWIINIEPVLSDQIIGQPNK